MIAFLTFSAFLITSAIKPSYSSTVFQHDVSPMLSELFLDYDSNVRPTPKYANRVLTMSPSPAKNSAVQNINIFNNNIDDHSSVQATDVNVSIHIVEMYQQSDLITFTLILMQSWQDDRLEFKSPEILKAKSTVLLDKIWTPDTFPLNAVDSQPLNNGFVEITNQGVIKFSRLWKIIICYPQLVQPMHYGLFPANESDDSSTSSNTNNKNNGNSNSNKNETFFLKGDDSMQIINGSLIFMTFVYDQTEVSFNFPPGSITVDESTKYKLDQVACCISNHTIIDKIYSTVHCTYSLRKNLS